MNNRKNVNIFACIASVILIILGLVELNVGAYELNTNYLGELLKGFAFLICGLLGLLLQVYLFNKNDRRKFLLLYN